MTAKLSRDMSKRVGLPRTLVMNPKLLLGQIYLPVRVVGILREAKRCCVSRTMRFSYPPPSNEQRTAEAESERL
jgi:hypothetical protein